MLPSSFGRPVDGDSFTVKKFMKIFIYSMTNSGFYFYNNTTGILIDGLYGRGPYQCFSPFPQSLFHQVIEKKGIFSHMDGLFFTHEHGDHKDADLLYYVTHNYRAVSVYSYEDLEGKQEIQQMETGIYRLRFSGYEIYFVDVEHEGRKSGDALLQVKTCMMVIRVNGEQITLLSDALIQEREIRILNRFGRSDLLICNPLQLAEKQKCEYLEELHAKRILISHLPLPEDDIYDYWRLAKQKSRKCVIGGVHPELPEQLNWLDGRIPDFIIL